MISHILYTCILLKIVTWNKKVIKTFSTLLSFSKVFSAIMFEFLKYELYKASYVFTVI